MIHGLTYPKENSVYTPRHLAIAPTGVLGSELHLTDRDSAAEVLADMDEYTDCFKINMAVPGVKREDIFIHVEDNILSVAVLKRHCENFKKGKLQVIKFDRECPGRQIHLPANAATKLVTSEYRQGILSIYIPKTQ